MRIAIIADIHGNLEALQEALKIIETRQVDRVVCLGDIVGYGASPNECTARVREVTQYVLLGNHDQASVDLAGAENFNPYAYASARWTTNHVSAEQKEFIRQLPFTLELEGLFFVHASPYEPEQWHYILSSADARDNFDHFAQDICFVGHSHVPGIFRPHGSAKPSESIRKGEKYIINVGSVGQPRDGDWRLSFGIFDTEAWQYENIRAEYDVEIASEKILKAGLPRMLGERILVGR